MRVHIRIYHLTQTMAVTYYMTDPSSGQGGHPMTNKTATVLIITKIWSRVPEKLDAKTDWVSCKATLTRQSLYIEDGGSIALRNVDILPQQYTASLLRTRKWKLLFCLVAFQRGPVIAGFCSLRP